MKQTVTKHMFVDSFRVYGRTDSFSVAAREALFDYFEQLEDDIGEEIELDPIAICCDWAEYTLDELRQDYPDQIEENRQSFSLGEGHGAVSHGSPLRTS